MQICEGCTHFCDILFVTSVFFLFFFNHMSQILECVWGLVLPHNCCPVSRSHLPPANSVSVGLAKTKSQQSHQICGLSSLQSNEHFFLIPFARASGGFLAERIKTRGRHAQFQSRKGKISPLNLTLVRLQLLPLDGEVNLWF